MINAEDQSAIKATADKLLTDVGVPIVVVTIESLGRYGASGWPIEGYASSLFDAWGIGRQDRNYGILLLVSKGDRKVRIEFGRGYSRDRDARATRIISSQIIPKFRQGDFSGGIRDDRDIAAQSPETAYRLAREVDGPDVDCLFVSCTNFPTLPVIQALEADTGKPVVTSNQATIWDSLRRAGVREPLHSAGRLLEVA